MSRIWKYELKARGECSVEMPARAKILSVGCVLGVVVLWAAVDPLSKSATRRFRVYFSGFDEVAPAMIAGFLGTVVNQETGIVSHVFEVFP